jgi:phosphoribosylanthranilate isomerase
MEVRIKICCINSIAEALTAIEYGADAVGLVGRMPSGPGPIQDDLINKIARAVPPPVGTFLLTSETSVTGIINHHERTNTNTIQIVDLLTDGSYSQIRESLPFIKIVQVIHVIDLRSVDLAIKLSESVDAILLDSGNPDLKVKEL